MTTVQRGSFVFYVVIYALTTLMSRNCEAQPTTVRPYQFGFTIEEQQHRFEKRDEHGIVMGEFGFITADGIYHVTVYATDEEGRFRILAMKNYPYALHPKTIDMTIAPKMATTKRNMIAATLTTPPAPQIDFGQKACSGCFLPKKGTTQAVQAENPKTVIPTLSKTIDLDDEISGTNLEFEKMITDMARAASNLYAIKSNTSPITQYTQTLGEEHSNLNEPPKTLSNTNNNNHNNYRSPTKIESPIDPVTHAKAPKIQPKVFPMNAHTSNSVQLVLPIPTTNTGNINAIAPSVNKRVNPLSTNALPIGSRAGPDLTSASKSGSGSGSGSRTGPELGLRSGSRSGSPHDNTHDNAGDLYRFKYILDYNGHTETGSRNGNKMGNFYTIGDDNVERTVEYVANDLGFQPRIHWRKINPNDIQSKENTLKDYEFVWFKQP